MDVARFEFRQRQKLAKAVGNAGLKQIRNSKGAFKQKKRLAALTKNIKNNRDELAKEIAEQLEEGLGVVVPEVKEVIQ